MRPWPTRIGDNMYALDAASGRILWRFASGGSVASVPCPGTVTPRYCPAGNDKFYAFGLPAAGR
jgi:outer membrane protein assembly factor BamB